jgi:hypothetical protein
MNGIAEGVRQVRGTSVNQVPDVEHVVVTAGTGVPTSGLILGVDRCPRLPGSPATRSARSARSGGSEVRMSARS